MPTLILGDSHTDIFTYIPNTNRFDMGKCNTVLFTTHRFTDKSDSDLWTNLDNWLASRTINSANPDKVLVVTGGEIDIRAHFWRHIPRHYKEQSNIEEYVKANALKLFNTLVDLCEQYQLEKIIVWSAPPAGEKATYNYAQPFSGDSCTRNKLIHMWNREFAYIINDDKRFSLTTAYYDFIDTSTYTTISTYPSPDGVHWDYAHGPWGPSFWGNIIAPAIQTSGIYVSNNWNQIADDQFDIDETTSTGNLKYDTWVRTEQISNIELIEKHVDINGKSYSWVVADNRHLLPPEYNELFLKKL